MASLTLPLAAATEEKPKPEKCKILSLKGGGIHGAWEAGVIKAIAENMPPDAIDYSHVGGVSIGAINASIFSVFPPGQEKQAAAKIEEMYSKYTTADLFHFYSPIFLAPFQHKSLADLSPFNDVLAGILGDKEFARKLSLMVCDLNKAQPLIVDETLTMEERVELILSSASIPFAFPPHQIDDMFLVDGGTFSNVAIGDPIERCREEGYADRDIIIDVLLCYEKPWILN